jgi:hypothetical protein
MIENPESVAITVYRIANEFLSLSSSKSRRVEKKTHLMAEKDYNKNVKKTGKNTNTQPNYLSQPRGSSTRKNNREKRKHKNS